MKPTEILLVLLALPLIFAYLAGMTALMWLGQTIDRVAYGPRGW